MNRSQSFQKIRDSIKRNSAKLVQRITSATNTLVLPTSTSSIGSGNNLNNNSMMAASYSVNFGLSYGIKKDNNDDIYDDDYDSENHQNIYDQHHESDNDINDEEEEEEGEEVEEDEKSKFLTKPNQNGSNLINVETVNFIRTQKNQ
jgi:hypothetical protein